jgi:hypothetical protein
MKRPAESLAEITSSDYRTPETVAQRNALLAKARRQATKKTSIQLDPLPKQRSFEIPLEDEEEVEMDGAEAVAEVPAPAPSRKVVSMPGARQRSVKIRKGTPLMPKRTVGGLREFLLMLLSQPSKSEKVTIHTSTGDLNFTVMDCVYNEGAFFFLFHKDEFTFSPKTMLEFDITFRGERQVVFYPGVNFCFDGWPYCAIILIAKPS